MALEAWMKIPLKKCLIPAPAGKQRFLNISDEKTEVMDNSAVIAYLIELEFNSDGKKSSMKCACSSAWIKEGNNWVCALHTESQLKK